MSLANQEILRFSEQTPGVITNVGGLLRKQREPVGVILGPQRVSNGLFCALLYLHPHLLPGTYELENGMHVKVPAKLRHQVEIRNVTLEVDDGQEEGN